MSLAIAAAVLPLLAIGADDARLETKRTYVSQDARSALAVDDGERVLCLDRERERVRSICLTEAQWAAAIALAESNQQSGKGPAAFIPRDLDYNRTNPSQAGLAPFRTR